MWTARIRATSSSTTKVRSYLRSQWASKSKELTRSITVRICLFLQRLASTRSTRLWTKYKAQSHPCRDNQRTRCHGSMPVSGLISRLPESPSTTSIMRLLRDKQTKLKSARWIRCDYCRYKTCNWSSMIPIECWMFQNRLWRQWTTTATGSSIIIFRIETFWVIN